jgi:hypothetical protein
MMRPVDMLRRLETALEAERALPGDVATWLLDGIVAYRKQGGRMSLCRCLALRGPGKRRLDTLSAYERRDAALQMAAEFIADRPVSPWNRAERLARAIAHYTTGQHRLARLADGAEHWRRARVATYLDQACQSGIKLPETPQQIYALLHGKKSR